MADPELVKKTLRAVLQANQAGVSLSQLQAEYKELTGEQIPHKQMGHNSLDALLASMPSIIQVEHTRSGETVYLASVVNEAAHVAKIVARQHTSKKTGRLQLVNTQMRVKPFAPLVFSAKPQTSLRQPDHHRRDGGRGGGGGQWAAHGDFRHIRDMRDSQSESKCRPHQHKLSNQNTPARKPNTPTEKSDKRMTLPSRFQKEVHAHLSRNFQQSTTLLNLNQIPVSEKGKVYNSQQVQGRIKEILAKYSNGFWVSKLPQIYRELYKQDLPSEAIKDLESWTHICAVEKPCSSNRSELLLYPANEQAPAAPNTPTVKPWLSPAPHTRPPSTPSPASFSPSPTLSAPSSPATLCPELKHRLEELLVKYSNGLWAHALPKLFQDTYKSKLPGHVLENLQLLSDICIIDYPMADNPKRAILYKRAGLGNVVTLDENCNKKDSSASREELRDREEVGRRLNRQEVPPLQIPREKFPSVLVVEATNTNGVVLRYIGEGYSQAQESMEDEMREFYLQGQSSPSPLSSPASGQIVAVRDEEEGDILRAQVCVVMADDKIKVYYVDHGFSNIISKCQVFELHENFFKLPFQATKCKLAGLEPFSQDPAVLKAFDAIASGRILLAEILELGERPLMALYDTSHDNDVNVNAACMKALQDKTLSSFLQVNSVCMNMAVTSVCSDGTVFCQLPSKGLGRLYETLDKIEDHFHSQVTSEFLVSRPFSGKVCVARYKDKWSRVEITNVHGNRVLDILFVDMGIQASVEVFELREVPPPYLRDLMIIPPQVVKCCMADLAVSLGSWTPEAVQWLRERVLTTDCSMTVAKMDNTTRCISIYLYTDKNVLDPACSLNHQMSQSDLFKQHPDVSLTSPSPAPSPSSPSIAASTTVSTNGNPTAKPHVRRTLSELSTKAGPQTTPTTTPPVTVPLQPPPLLELPPAGSNMDVYVSVACHPGHFVLQPWRDMYKLVVLMGEMILYYSKTEEQPLNIENNQIYAAKVENNWHRVLVKGFLPNGLVSVYELDYGKHELVRCTQLRPLMQQFRQLPFQGITAQLAGVKPGRWSEEASIVFRNHVEQKPLVAQLEAILESTHPWEMKLTVFLVDTSKEERDVWVHDIMAEFIDHHQTNE